VLLTVPPEPRVNPSTPSPVAALETNAASPVAADGVTVMFTFTLCPAVIPVVGFRVRLTLVGVKALTPVLQLFTKLCAFTEPSPVARS
jgi:hypothetical protein